MSHFRTKEKEMGNGNTTIDIPLLLIEEATRGVDNVVGQVSGWAFGAKNASSTGNLLLWTLIYKPKLLSLAVTLAIDGNHYPRICEKYIFFDSDGEMSVG